MANHREVAQSAAWLETELARQLCPVTAPDSLWSRIHEQRRPLRVCPHPWTAWSIAAAALLLLSAGLAWRLGATRDPSADLESLAGQELRGIADGTGKIDFRSDDPEEIRNWIKARLDVDVRPLDQPVPGMGVVRLLGARIVRLGSSSVVAIGYRVGDDFAAMLVTDGRGRLPGVAAQGHTSLQVRSSGNAQLYSWSQGSRDYAIAFNGTKSTRQPCLLCHADPAMLMVFK